MEDDGKFLRKREVNVPLYREIAHQSDVVALQRVWRVSRAVAVINKG